MISKDLKNTHFIGCFCYMLRIVDSVRTAIQQAKWVSLPNLTENELIKTI